MAILLVRNVDNALPIPASTELDTASSYKRGDIVEIFDDGHIFGAKEGLPRFIRIQALGVPSIAAWQIIQYRNDHADAEGKTVIRRRFRVPASICDSAQVNGGDLSINWGTLQSQIVDKTA